MTGQTTKADRVVQPANRLDRVERILEQLAERQIHAENRQDRTQAQLDALAERVNEVVGAVNLLAGFIASPGENG